MSLLNYLLYMWLQIYRIKGFFYLSTIRTYLLNNHIGPNEGRHNTHEYSGNQKGCRKLTGVSSMLRIRSSINKKLWTMCLWVINDKINEPKCLRGRINHWNRAKISTGNPHGRTNKPVWGVTKKHRCSSFPSHSIVA